MRSPRNPIRLLNRKRCRWDDDEVDALVVRFLAALDAGLLPDRDPDVLAVDDDARDDDPPPP